MIKKIKHYLNELVSLKHRLNDLESQVFELKGILTKKNDLKDARINLGQIQSHLNNQKEKINNLSEVEFQVFSQFGDDGIIQYLVSKTDIPNKTFIEFGVENYKESNTRFLLINNNWKGFVIDGSQENVDFIKNDVISWASDLTAECAFINAENINDLLAASNLDSEVGLLSIDIDGNDYWVWKAIDRINPVIVIVEYNSLFGKNNAWTIPYDPSFVRGNNASILYFGTSLKALQVLGEQKGYSLVGACSKGLNAYFIRNDKLGNFKARSAEDCYVFSNFRELRTNGNWVSGLERSKLIEGLEVIDVTTHASTTINLKQVQY